MSGASNFLPGDQDMSEAETVLYEVRDGIATVKINRPEMRNALSPAAANRLHDLWGEVDADKNVRVAILTSADCGTFCAGLDLREADRVKKEEGVDILTKMKDPFHGRQRRVAKPIIAAMTGHLIAGGMMLSLNSDLRVGLKGTQVGITETRMSKVSEPRLYFILPSWGMRFSAISRSASIFIREVSAVCIHRGSSVVFLSNPSTLLRTATPSSWGSICTSLARSRTAYSRIMSLSFMARSMPGARPLALTMSL